MTDLPLNEVVGLCGASAILVVLAAGIAWNSISRLAHKKGRAFVALFFFCAATVCAQKPPTPPAVTGIELGIRNVTAKGFDCSWNYGGLDPAGFTDGETVKLTAHVTGMDYTLLIGTLPPTVTNYHVNAVMRGFPKDWMAHDVKVTARLNNANIYGEAKRDGDESGELPSINGGNE